MMHKRISLQPHTFIDINAGAGIVFDSIAQRELEETKHKAEGVLKIFPKDKQRKTYE
jgi:anthranilate synthase component 1